ncbi:cation:proton antiporter [Methylocystis bryophila]|nr:cation:proton antiporter [Methylocystis bryophila]
MDDMRALFLIGLAAVIAPLLERLPAFMRTPLIVLELVLGILIGPGALNLVSSQGSIGFLGELGLIFLFFQAGLEFDPEKIGAAPLRLGALAWLVSLTLATLFAALLYSVGLLRAPLLVAIVLPTTAFGVLIPILRQAGELESEFGRYVLGSAAFGELGPILLAPILLAEAHEHLRQTALVMLFLAAAMGAAWLAKGARANGVPLIVARSLSDASALPLRVAILALLGFVSLASELGMEVVLGAYAAGVVLAALVRNTPAQPLERQLGALGSGFLVPLFFVTSGMELDLAHLITSPANLCRLSLFFLGFLVVRAAPVFLYRQALPPRDLTPLGLLSATTLPLVVAITYLGTRTGHMLPENATALVGAAVLSVAVFPTLALWLRETPDDARPDRGITNALCEFGDRLAAQYAQLATRLAPDRSREP